jgi:hypothetical protein
MNTEKQLRALLDKPFARVLLQGVLMRTLRRNPMGFLATLLVRRAMTGDGRVFGMDLASRRRARWAWLMALLQTHLAKTAAKSGQPAITRRLLR